MPKWLQVAWGVYALAWAALGLGVLENRRVGAAPGAGLELTPGEEVTLPVYRYGPDTPRLTLQFYRTHLERAELGNWSSIVQPGDKGGSGSTYFKEPGEPVVLEARVGERRVRLEALPAGSHTRDHLMRDMVVRPPEDDDAATRTGLVADPEILPAGHSRLNVRVVSVGRALQGERVHMYLRSPLGLKVSHPGYGRLWIFFFPCVLSGVLALPGVVLLALSLRRRPRPARMDHGAGAKLGSTRHRERLMTTYTLQDLAKKMADIDFVMLQTTTEGGEQAARPMSNNGDVDYDGDSWFFTYESTRMVADIRRDPKVGLSFTGSKSLLGKPPIFVAVQGHCHIHTDKASFAEHWVDDLERWFEQGIDTPGLVLLHVRASRITWWDGEDNGELRV